jgi:hypothetical protein
MSRHVSVSEYPAGHVALVSAHADGKSSMSAVFTSVSKHLGDKDFLELASAGLSEHVGDTKFL